MWAAKGGLQHFETEDLLSRLFDLSLLLDLDLSRRLFQLHTTIRHFLRNRLGKDGLIAQHKGFVAALDEGALGGQLKGATLSYFFDYLPHHLAEAGERERLDAPPSLDSNNLSRRALSRLRPEQREALTLVGVSDLSYEEAASITDIGIGTIKGRVSRARSKFHELLAREAKHIASRAEHYH